ncbi:hypothetical protein AAVH_33258, partial [Aphelenchoides avenae]
MSNGRCNAPCHVARPVREWFQQNGIRVVEWPAQSPDLNPIENLWNIVKRKIGRKNFSTKAGLFEAVSTAWDEIPYETIIELVNSMPKRCLEVICSNGMPI